jgi:hypothetical protein
VIINIGNWQILSQLRNPAGLNRVSIGITLFWGYFMLGFNLNMARFSWWFEFGMERGRKQAMLARRRYIEMIKEIATLKEDGR